MFRSASILLVRRVLLIDPLLWIEKKGEWMEGLKFYFLQTNRQCTHRFTNKPVDSLVFSPRDSTTNTLRLCPTITLWSITMKCANLRLRWRKARNPFSHMFRRSVPIYGGSGGGEDHAGEYCADDDSGVTTIAILQWRWYHQYATVIKQRRRDY